MRVPLIALVAALLVLALTHVTAVLAAGVVGTGTPESCTESALDAALAGGGTVTFNCGPEPVTITLGSEKVITAAMGETTVDGGGLVTLSGGGTTRIFNVTGGGMLEVQNLTIADGSVLGDEDGGGIQLSGTLTVTNSTFTRNHAGRTGGAISGSGGTVTVTNSTFAGNSAGGSGGGIFLVCVTMTVTNSTFADNSADWGGGIHTGEVCVMGGCCQYTGTVLNSTVSGNSGQRGGGILNSGGLTVTNSIVADNLSGGDCGGEAFTDGGHNLIGDTENACGLTNGENGNIVGVHPLLDPSGLRDNGGATQTIALLAGSPAINAGDPEVCTNPPVNGLDQRGYVRPGDGSTNCSIGAYEYLGSPGPTLTPTVTATATPSRTPTATPTSVPTATPTVTATPSATPSPSVTVTATTQPGDGGGGGCRVTPTHGSGRSALAWLLFPLLILLVRPSGGARFPVSRRW